MNDNPLSSVANVGDVLREDVDHFWHCPCGNDPMLDGFFPINSKYTPVEPVPELWDTGLYACHHCGAVINSGTRAVVDHTSVEALKRAEREAA